MRLSTFPPFVINIDVWLFANSAGSLKYWCMEKLSVGIWSKSNNRKIESKFNYLPSLQIVINYRNDICSKNRVERFDLYVCITRPSGRYENGCDGDGNNAEKKKKKKTYSWYIRVVVVPWHTISSSFAKWTRSHARSDIDTGLTTRGWERKRYDAYGENEGTFPRRLFIVWHNPRPPIRRHTGLVDNGR